MAKTFLAVEEQMEVLRRGAVDLVTEQELRDKLARSLATGHSRRGLTRLLGGLA